MKNVLSFVAGIVGWLVSQTSLLAILPKAVQPLVAPIAALLALLGIRTASTSPVTDALNKLGQGWKTIVGAIVAVIGYLLDPAVLGTLPASWAKTLQVVGVILGAIGLYHAQASK